jgi:hypothetical protein
MTATPSLPSLFSL